MDTKNIGPVFLFSLLLAILLLGGAFIIPWRFVSWGKIVTEPASTMTVTGSAKSQVKSQVAMYSAGINVVNDSKDKAVAEANQKIADIIAAVKEFGIPEADVKTQNLNIYQNEEMYYDNGTQKSRPGQWRVGNTIEVKLRDVSKSSQLADILTGSGANNIWGPNFSLDDTEEAETELMGQAIENAKTKAQHAASSSGRKLGKVLTVSEAGISGQPIYAKMEGAGGGGGMPTEAGSGTVEKTVIVVFELK